ncbi:MAG: PilZ domain-containing protein [Desulfobacterales bacterium]|nr:MAG: PilZ domain-containing protein [Desulfobacterales bacterium]
MNISGKAVKKYNTSILNLFQMILNLNENQQRVLLDCAEKLFLKEKRTNPRKPCEIPIYYATDDQVYSSHVKNISRSGLFIETQNKLPVGNIILMTFRLEGLDKPIKIRGEVAHTGPAGIGVRFIEPNSSLEAKVDTFVEGN